LMFLGICTRCLMFALALYFSPHARDQQIYRHHEEDKGAVRRSDTVRLNARVEEACLPPTTCVGYITPGPDALLHPQSIGVEGCPPQWLRLMIVSQTVSTSVAEW